MNKNKVYNIAYQYAPIFAQKISDEWKPADQIAPIDFPEPEGKKIIDEVSGQIINRREIGDLQKNPDKMMKLGDDEIIPAKIYYSVCETTTHFFLLYAVYHVLDWWKRYPSKNPYHIIRDKLDEHIHDMEGALLVVTKDPEKLVDGVITIAHGNYYLYSNELKDSSETNAPKFLKIAKFNENIDGIIGRDKECGRVKIYCESKGHGVHASKDKWGGGDQIWYYKPEGETADTRPDYARDSSKDQEKREPVKQFEYVLEDIFSENGLWDHRFDPEVFRQNKKGVWGFVCNDKKKGKKYPTKANPPWSWNDRNDSSPVGEMATDPARLIIRYAQGWGPVSTRYLYNPYMGINTEKD